MKRTTLISLIAVAGMLVFGSISAGSLIVPNSASVVNETEQSVNKTVSTDQSGLEVATLTVSNMYCAACPTIVRKTLEKVDGVVKAEVSYRNQQAIVTFHSAKSNATLLADAVSELGYPAMIIK